MKTKHFVIIDDETDVATGLNMITIVMVTIHRKYDVAESCWVYALIVHFVSIFFRKSLNFEEQELRKS